MKILLFTLEYPPFRGGVANYYGNIVKYWPEHNNIIVLNNNSGGLISHKLPFLKWLPAVVRLRKCIIENKIDYVLAGHILPLGTASFILSLFMKFKYAVIMNGVDFTLSQKNFWKRFLSKIILNKSDKIICGNNFLSLEAKKNFEKKTFIFNPGIDIFDQVNGEFINRLKLKYKLTNKSVLLSVGRLVERKGFARVINLMPELNKRIPNLVYVIVGNGPDYNKLSDQIKSQQLNNIILINDADDKERNAWLSLCDIFIMISENIKGDYEGFGIVYLEANSAGKPVIAGDSGGVRDAVIDNETGLLVNPKNDEEIINAVRKLSFDKELRDRLGQNGKLRALNQFEWSRHINDLYQILNI